MTREEFLKCTNYGDYRTVVYWVQTDDDPDGHDRRFSGILTEDESYPEDYVVITYLGGPTDYGFLALKHVLAVY